MSFIRKRELGFTLVEALIALLVLAFGMLAITTLSLKMSRGSEVAKQRSEALRMARGKIEELRAFEKVASDGARADYAEDIASGSDTFGPSTSSNTTFRRTWTVTREDGAAAADASDPMKWLSIAVQWSDRSGDAHSVVLRSVVARSEPAFVGALINAPTAGRIRPPHGRSVGVPTGAVQIGRGKSGYIPPGAAGMFYVIDDATAAVERICSGTPTRGFATEDCTPRQAYLLSGFIRFDMNAAPSAASVANASDATREMLAAISFIGMPAAHPPAQCFAQRQRTLRNPLSGEEITLPEGNARSGFTETRSTFVAYACAVEPFDHDAGDKTAKVWSGQFVIVPRATGGIEWTIGGGAGEFRLCRYSGDYNGDDRLSNAEHPLVYRNVVGALQNQNYVVLPGHRDCPADAQADPQRGKSVNANTVLHQSQPVAIGSPPFGGLPSTGQWSGNDETGGERAFPML